MVLTGRVLAEATRALLQEGTVGRVLAEPIAKNTAPAVAWASRVARRSDPDAVVIVLPADAYIENEEAFRSALALAVTAAADGAIVTLGVRPTRPETGYGYLRVGESTSREGVRRVEAFVEKPDLAHATAYVRDGFYLWNAGIFVFRASVMDDAVRAHLPALAEGLDRVDEAVALHGLSAEDSAIDSLFAGIDGVSIDYGVMEKVPHVHVVAVDCGWSDVGSWQASWELGTKDENDNVVRVGEGASVVLEDSRGNVVSAGAGKVVALIGVEDLVVVDTPDALLVLPRARAQEVKRAVDALAAKRRTDVL